MRNETLKRGARGKRRATAPSAWWSAGLVALGLTLASPASAQTPPDPYSYSRVVAYTYDAAGRVATETVEPDNPALCVLTTYGYDAYGNKSSATVANCAGIIPTRQQFEPRTAGADYAPATTPTVIINGVGFSLPKGVFPLSTTNALGHVDKFEYDPRFGAVTKSTPASGLVSTSALDNFGRKTRVTSVDGTSAVYRYCYIVGRVSDLTSNTAGCDTSVPAEAPADAVSYVHTEPRSTSDAKMGPYSRVYVDRLGREIRSVTESFDGPTQPASLAASLIVKDTVYSAQGSKLMETQPYFLATGSSTTTGSQDTGVTLTRYDAIGRPTVLFAADPNGLGGSSFSFNRDGGGGFGYASYGSRTVSSTRYNYAGLSTTLINDKGQQRVDEKNALGLLVRVTDEAGGQLAHQHDAFNNLLVSKDALQNLTTLTYDIRGRKVQLNDPDSGVWKYDYNPLGQLVWQENPNQRAAGTAITMVYDKLGRMTSRSEPEGTGIWTYDANLGNGILCFKGALCASSYTRAGTSDTRTKATAYDNYGRIVRSLATVTGSAPGPAMATANSYDTATGRLLTKTYPTGLQVAYNYTARGFVKQMTLPANATVSPMPATPGGAPGATVNLGAGSSLWQAGVINAWGKDEQSGRGNGVISRASYEAATGRTTALSAGAGTSNSVLDYNFAWDSLNNLIYRADNIGDAVAGAVTENFEYGDALARLTKYTVNAAGVPGGSRVVDLQYNALGMLLSKSDVGSYTYPTAGSARPHALATLNAVDGSTTTYQYDDAGNLTSASNGKYRSITYTSFNLPDSQSGIVGAPSGAYGGTAQHTWVYDESHTRIKEVRTITGGSQAGTRTLWYLHPDNAGGLGFESEVNSPTTPTADNPAQTTNRHFLSIGGQAIGVIITTGNLPTPGSDGSLAGLSSATIKRLEYWHKDHLGSLLATTDHAATVTQRYAYDPFGKRRQVNGSYDAFGAIVIDWGEATNAGTNRGYTGHEHLDDIGLIHMNGRIFDPRIGLFLQPDQRIQQPNNLQNYNRYAYCFNNPLTCADPTGLWGWNVHFAQTFSAALKDGKGVWGAFKFAWDTANADFGTQDVGSWNAALHGLRGYLDWAKTQPLTPSQGYDLQSLRIAYEIRMGNWENAAHAVEDPSSPEHGIEKSPWGGYESIGDLIKHLWGDQFPSEKAAQAIQNNLAKLFALQKMNPQDYPDSVIFEDGKGGKVEVQLNLSLAEIAAAVNKEQLASRFGALIDPEASLPTTFRSVEKAASYEQRHWLPASAEARLEGFTLANTRQEDLAPPKIEWATEAALVMGVTARPKKY